MATAKALAALKANVYIADYAKEAPAALANNPRVHFTGGCDVSQRQACKDFVDSIPGRLDGLVNCAGTAFREGKIASDEMYQRIMAVNVTGTWNMGTEALQRMSKQDNKQSSGLFSGTRKDVGQGSIVNISSGAGVRHVPGLAVYTASKHAVIGLTRTWASDFPHLRVNAVLPGTSLLTVCICSLAIDPSPRCNGHSASRRRRRSRPQGQPCSEATEGPIWPAG